MRLCLFVNLLIWLIQEEERSKKTRNKGKDKMEVRSSRKDFFYLWPIVFWKRVFKAQMQLYNLEKCQNILLEPVLNASINLIMLCFL
jgi:hypothetical protein